MGTHLRNFGAAVLGYVVMFVIVSILMLIVGLVAIFGDAMGMLVAASIVVSLLAAVVGGLVCAKVAADNRGTWILMAAIVVIAVVSALWLTPMVEEMGAIAEGAEGAMADSMDDLQEPAWMTWLNPVLGIVGVYFGARLANKGG